MPEITVTVLSLKDFNTYQPAPGAIAISVIDHKYTGPDDVKALNRYRASLQLDFEDWEFERDKSQVKMFTDAHALAIYKFVAETNFGFRDGNNELVVHCYQGISRSPAVAIGVCIMLQNYEKAVELMKKYLGYNRYVLGMMIRNSGKVLADAATDGGSHER